MPLPGDGARVADLSFEELEHELKTPIASIRSLSEIMRDYPDLTADERRRFLDAMIIENERLSRAVDRVLGAEAESRGLS
jgi:signal transduction histidine kinase